MFSSYSLGPHRYRNSRHMHMHSLSRGNLCVLTVELLKWSCVALGSCPMQWNRDWLLYGQMFRSSMSYRCPLSHLLPRWLTSHPRLDREPKSVSLTSGRWAINLKQHFSRTLSVSLYLIFSPEFHCSSLSLSLSLFFLYSSNPIFSTFYPFMHAFFFSLSLHLLLMYRGDSAV